MGPPPSYSEAAAGYNERVERLTSLWAEAVVEIDWTDGEGTARSEQGTGVLQVARPRRLALSVGKMGEKGLWIGCDERRWWWFELYKKKIAHVGSERAAQSSGTRAGLAVHPLDLLPLLGVLPMPVEPERELGSTQWSSDGTLLGVSTRGRAGGATRVWLDPESWEPRKVELFDARDEVEVVADLRDYDFVSLRGDGSIAPRAPGLIWALHVPTGASVRLYLSAHEDGARRISPEAFDFEALSRRFAVERVIQEDERRDGSGAPDGPTRQLPPR
ncbi:MAG: hypothetical protein JNM07_02865 [Phycisphaerae bacterium]|nr:hypothetical protein [Phycisphaerae bacterium]